jgi:HSP20 family molecular chaperone IbpA
MANAIFGSPTRHPIQDKKTVLTKNGILKITAEKKENVNGKHST